MKTCSADVARVPTVSIIMPVYRIVEYVGEAINSVVGQTFANWELICVVDGSDDGSCEICEAFALDDPRILVISQQHRSLGSARNTDIKYAGGQYLYFLDGDDLIVPEALEACVKAAVASGAEIVQFGASVTIEDGRWHKTDKYVRSRSYPGVWDGAELYVAQRKVHGYIAQACMYMSRAGVFHHNGVLFPEGIIHEDEYATYRALTQSRSVVCLDNLLYIRRYRPHSILSDRDGNASARGYFKSYKLVLSEDMPMLDCDARLDAHNLCLDALARLCITCYYKNNRPLVEFADVIGAGMGDEQAVESLLTSYVPLQGRFPLSRAVWIVRNRIGSVCGWFLGRFRKRLRRGLIHILGTDVP